MVIHAQQQGRDEAAGEPIETIQAAAVVDGHPLHRQVLLHQPAGFEAGRPIQIPAAGRLAQQHLGGEVVAFGVGQAQQPQHRGGGFLMHQHRVLGQGGLGGDHGDAHITPLLGHTAL